MIMQGSKRKIAMRWISRTCGCHKMPSSTRRTAHFHWMGVCCNYSIVANFGNHSASSIKILSQSRKQYKRCGSWPTWYFRCLNNFWDLNATSSYPSKYLIICNMRVVIVVHSKTIWYSWYMLIYVDIHLIYNSMHLQSHFTEHSMDPTNPPTSPWASCRTRSWANGAVARLWSYEGGMWSMAVSPEVIGYQEEKLSDMNDMNDSCIYVKALSDWMWLKRFSEHVHWLYRTQWRWTRGWCKPTTIPTPPAGLIWPTLRKGVSELHLPQGIHRDEWRPLGCHAHHAAPGFWSIVTGFVWEWVALQIAKCQHGKWRATPPFYGHVQNMMSGLNMFEQWILEIQLPTI